MGLPISFTKYCIKNNRLYTSSGFLSSKEDELLYRVLDLKLERSFLNKIFKVGVITLYTCDETDKEIKLINIKNPRATRDIISNLVEEARRKQKIIGKEIYGVSRNDEFEINE